MSSLTRYLLSVAILAAALGLQILLQPWIGQVALMMLYPAIFLINMVAGAGPGLLATALGALGANYFFMSHRFFIPVQRREDVYRLLGFVATALMMTWLMHRERRVRRKLRQRRDEFKLLADSMAQLVWITDLRGEVEYINQRWYDYTGQSPLTLSKQNWIDATHPDDRTMAFGAHLEAVRSHSEFKIEYRVRRHDGVFRWHLARTVIVRDHRGEPLKRFGTATDIHDQKVAREEAATAAQQLQLITDRLPSFISYVDTDGRYRFVNRAYEDWFEVDRSQILGRTRAELAGEAVGANAQPWQKRAMAGESVRYETVLMRRGETRIMDTEMVPDIEPGSGKLRGLVVVGHDITQRKRELQDAELNRKNLYNLFMQAPVGICVFEGPQHVVALANATFMETLFGEPRDFVGLPIREATPEGEGQGYFELLDQVYRTGEPVVGTESPVHIVTRAGVRKELFVNYIYQAKRDLAGEVDGILVILTDVTASTLAKRGIEQAIQVRDEFLSIASHELRTPITAMRLQAQMMKRRLERADPTVFDPARVRKLVEQTDQSVERMNRLVEDMLDISRIQGGRLRLRPEALDWAALARESVERLAAPLLAAGIEVVFDGEISVPIVADRFRLEQVFTNLITNAVRYAPGGPLRIGFERDGRIVRLVFQDHGPGIAPENRERIFLRFERLIPSSEISGLGLGLYIVREILRAHGGTIRAEGSPGEGARFVVELPGGT